MNHKFGIALAGLTLGAAAFAQTKWDLPTAYPASNFHTENITKFADPLPALLGDLIRVVERLDARLSIRDTTGAVATLLAIRRRAASRSGVGQTGGEQEGLR